MTIIKEYNISTNSIKTAELFEIANKYKLYKKTPSKWYLKPFYAVAYSIALFLARQEQKNAV